MDTTGGSSEASDSLVWHLVPDEESTSTLIQKGAVEKYHAKQPLPLRVLKSILMNVWSYRGTWKMEEVKPGVYTFWISSAEECKRVLSRRPWSINNCLLILKPWPESRRW